MIRLLHIFVLLICLSAKAQEPPVAFTYIHIDKNIYVPGETIWLKAYLPSTSKRLNQTLLVRLADSRKNIILAREFPAYDLRAHGQLVLPDSIPTGQYNLIAYGNNTGPDTGDVFSQSINIVKNTDGTPLVSVQVAENTVLAPGSKITLQIGLQQNSRPIADAKGKCSINIQGVEKPMLIEKLKTDANGLATVTVTYPDIGSYQHLAVKGALIINNKPVPFSLMLSSQKKAITITVLPEGGAAISGIKNTITVQAIDDNSQLVSGVTVSLMQGSAPQATAVTDAHGLAIIYSVLQDKPYSIAATFAPEGFSTQIPVEVKKQGLSLTLTAGNRLMIRNTGATQKTRLELWSAGEVLFAKDLTVAANESLPIALPASAEKRIISSGLFNPQGQLTNERVFYTGTQNGYTVTADFGTQKITPRQNITATLTVTDAVGKPVQANLSAAVVHAALIDKSRYKTITASRYSAITNVTDLQYIMGFDDTAINNYLGTKKWRGNLRFPSGKFINTKPGIDGTVISKNKKPVKMQHMVVMTPQGPQPVKVNQNGSFSISPEYLLAYEGEKCYLFFGNDELNRYTLSFTTKNDPEFTLPFQANTYALQSQTAALPNIPGAIQLDEVVIQKKSTRISEAEYQRWVRDYPRGCPDWICYSGEINCTVHNMEDRSKKPVIGQTYYYEGKPIVYTECIDAPHKAERTVNLATITLPEAFPVTEFIDEFEKKFYTTIAWLPNIDTDANGRATVTFTTSDLEGNFIMVLQGLNITDNTAIYGEAALQVTAGK